jgi:TolA-binding protein
MRSIRFSANLIIILLLTVLLATPTHSSQDLNYRLMTIERRLDQLQYRVDAMERFQQTQSLNATSANITPAAVLELQRQQISLAEQAVTMQKQMLEMQKTIDRLSEKLGGQEKKPEEKPKPRSLNGKP